MNNKVIFTINSLLRVVLTSLICSGILYEWNKAIQIILVFLTLLTWGVTYRIEGIFDGIEMKKADKENDL